MAAPRVERWLKTLGPGILFASTCIGVSHLVQSTRAGALAGFGLVWAVVAANAAKYPFFEFGSRYASATGTSLIEGYRKLGRLASWGYLATGLATGIFVVAAVGLVTAAFLDALLGISAAAGTPPRLGWRSGCLWPPRPSCSSGNSTRWTSWSSSSPACSCCPPWWRSCSAWPRPRSPSRRGVAGMGPGHRGRRRLPDCVDGLDAHGGRLEHVEQHLDLERIEASGYRPPFEKRCANSTWVRGLGLLAFGFLTLGALLLHRTARRCRREARASPQASSELYARASDRGARPSWGQPPSAPCWHLHRRDGRVRPQLVAIACGGLGAEASARWGQVALLTVAAGGLAIVVMFSGQIKQLVDLATTLSFLVAPLVAFWNLRLVTRSDFPVDARPGRGLQAWAWAGLAFLTAFTLWFLWIQFVA